MWNKKIFVGLLIVIITISFGQQKRGIEYSGFFDSYYFRGPLAFTFDGGINLYYGDLSKRKIGPNASIGVIYKLWPRVSFGSEIIFIIASANDHVPSRGYSYNGTNFGLSGYGRYYLREDIITRHSQLHKKKSFKPYFQFGFSSLYYSPKTTDGSGNTLASQSKLPITLSLPLGLGADFIASNRITIAPEALYYYTFTDNLDNVNSSNAVGVSNAKDSYLTVGIKITYSPFTPRKKRKKLSNKEIELLMENNNDNVNPGSNNSNNTDGAVKDTETTEEYQSDENLLDIEEPEEELIDENLLNQGEEESNDNNDSFENENNTDNNNHNDSWEDDSSDDGWGGW